MQEHNPAPGNNFESCPAATGVSAGCESFPDGAHRCAADRGHGTVHACTDGASWWDTVGPKPVPSNRFRGETK